MGSSRRSGSSRSPRKKPVRYQEPEDSEEGSEEETSRRERVAHEPSNADGEVFGDEDHSGEELGRRRGSRRRMQIPSPRHNFRPQRSSGQTARNNYREETEDDNDGGGTSQEDPGVSSRGRIRRPNPRLL